MSCAPRPAPCVNSPQRRGARVILQHGRQTESLFKNAGDGEVFKPGCAVRPDRQAAAGVDRPAERNANAADWVFGGWPRCRAPARSTGKSFQRCRRLSLRGRCRARSPQCGHRAQPTRRVAHALRSRRRSRARAAQRQRVLGLLSTVVCASTRSDGQSAALCSMHEDCSIVHNPDSVAAATSRRSVELVKHAATKISTTAPAAARGRKALTMQSRDEIRLTTLAACAG